MRLTVLRPLVFALPLVLVSATASAHFNLKAPPSASKSTNGGKGPPPCGPTSDSGVVTAVQGGHEIDLTVTETINHGGFYRAALSLGSRDELPPDNVVYDSKGMVLPPTGMPKGTSDHADFEASPKFPVLGDHLFAHDNNATPKEYTGKILLPNVNCDKCTLQVIEFMAPHGFNGTSDKDGGGYFYHQCADLKITADPALPIFDPKGSMGGAGGGGAGGNAGMGGSAGAATAGTGGTAPAGNGGAGGTASPTGGTASNGTAGTATSAGTASGGTTPATGSGGASGTGTGTGTNPGGASAEDDGGCSIGKSSRGAASLVVALGIGLSLLRRRRRAV